MRVRSVKELEFIPYGRVVEGYEVSGLTEAMKKTPLPEDVVYVASVPELEALPEIPALAGGLYGQMPVQVGFCNGHNRKLNALEYHRDSEFNLAVTDLVLLLGRQQDMTAGYTYDTSLVEAFYVPAGTLIEVYATTLHYAPCHTEDGGFRCAVILPRGTNEELDHPLSGSLGEERLLFAKNKWLLGHKEGGLPEHVWIGLKGKNICL